MMQYNNPQEARKKRHEPELVEVSESCFVGSSGVEEYHFMLVPLQYGRLADQLQWLEAAMQNCLSQHELKGETVLFKRFLCSDLANHMEEIRRHPISNPQGGQGGVVSLINQPPQPPAKIALWAYCVKDPISGLNGRMDGNSFILRRGELEHVWTAGLTAPQLQGARQQTQAIFDTFNAFLESRNMTLEENCIRTWFFVKDIDTNYNGMVIARNDVFSEYGLTEDTHYIASTGIEGSHSDVHSLVTMDAYSIGNLIPGQVRHLHALDHLSHTHVYGVAFERGSSVAYADRKHVFISGTASIDHRGQIVHPGDVLRQLDRTLENIQALLAEEGAALDDMQQYIVYLRDPSDVEIIRDLLKERIGDVPFLVVSAPVCRPSWLIEIEGIAIIQNQDDEMPRF